MVDFIPGEYLKAPRAVMGRTTPGELITAVYVRPSFVDGGRQLHMLTAVDTQANFLAFEDEIEFAQTPVFEGCPGATVPTPGATQPEFGTYAYTARMMVELGIMDGDEADQWKDMMKEGDYY